LETTLKGRISQRTARIGVLGMGYVGLPLAIRLAEEAFQVVGIDVNREVVERLKAGNSTVEGISDKRLRDVLGTRLNVVLANEKNPEATTPRVLSKLFGVDAFVVCVPTPLDQTKELEPDTSYIERACAMIGRICALEKRHRKLPKERLLVLESTTYPGTTRKLFSPILDEYGSGERRWYLAYSPERISPGPGAFAEKAAPVEARRSGEERYPPAFEITRIVGGKDRPSQQIAAALYKTAFKRGVRPVSSLETAEMVKLVENTFRFIAVAFANEIAPVAKMLGLDVWEIIDAARTKKFGFELCFPGLIGGHCIPIDPHYLAWAIRNRRLAATFVDVAESEHQNLRREAFDLIQRLLNQQNKGIAGASVLFFGVSYKKNVGDIRESAAIKLMEKLYASGAKVSFWDPVRAKQPAKPRIRLLFTKEQRKALPDKLAARLKWDAEKGKYYVEPKEMHGNWDKLKRQVLGTAFSCVVLASDHDDFRSAYADLALTKDAPPIADLCNAINWWLRDTKFRAGEKRKIKQKLGERRAYMLLGRH